LTSFREVQLEVDKVRFDVLIKHLTILKTAKKKVASNYRDFSSTCRGSCLTYLDVEISILTSEASEIDMKHHLSTGISGSQDYGVDESHGGDAVNDDFTKEVEQIQNQESNIDMTEEIGISEPEKTFDNLTERKNVRNFCYVPLYRQLIFEWW